MKILKIFLICLLLTSCNTPRAVYDYDEQVRFDNYNTYALFPDFLSGLSQLDDKRIIASLDDALQEKGFSISEDPDLYVNFYAEEYQENNPNSLGVGMGGGGGNLGVGVSGGIPLGGPDTYLRLTFDFIDVEDDSLMWQAIVESKFDKDARPEKRRAQLDKIVEKALEGYPPKK